MGKHSPVIHILLLLFLTWSLGDASKVDDNKVLTKPAHEINAAIKTPLTEISLFPSNPVKGIMIQDSETVVLSFHDLEPNEDYSVRITYSGLHLVSWTRSWLPGPSTPIRAGEGTFYFSTNEAGQVNNGLENSTIPPSVQIRPEVTSVPARMWIVVSFELAVTPIGNETIDFWEMLRFLGICWIGCFAIASCGFWEYMFVLPPYQIWPFQFPFSFASRFDPSSLPEQMNKSKRE